ncbi:SLC13 family permease [Algoriphagus sp. SE2]|uniref:SLC13 family permease n=1 Tax=Algoriphagus sp. SE2 TaxID=3141536 RepID=UPI0031CD512B
MVLFKNWIRPSLAFLTAVFLFILIGILSIDDFLLGLANKQIVLIFLLIILTSGIQKNLGKEFFYKIFSKRLSSSQFRIRMMVLVSGLSSVLNNTPVVAFMIPFVKDWADSNGYSPSKFLIPLSFVTILGGMVTLIGTSTNLVLNGLIIQSGLDPLNFQDFLYLGLIVTLIGLAYLSIFSEKLLPNNKGSKEEIIGHLNEYLVETKVNKSSPLIGKTIEEAGLRHLKELFLVEIKRGNRSITAVSSDRLINAEDILFFAGNTKSILNLINEKNGLELPEESQIYSNRFSALSEAVIPSGSDLVGQTIKESGFRDRFKASIISVHRKGEKVSGNLGQIKLMAGDLILLMGSRDFEINISNREIILLSKTGEISGKLTFNKILPSILSGAILLLGVFGIIDLFLAAFVGIILMMILNVLSIQNIKNAVDLDLLVILISALTIGIAIQSSGTASYVVKNMNLLLIGASPLILISVLYLITLGLTSLITNAAAVSIMFPIAYEMGLQAGLPLTPFFIAIAFAASADFMTPIGYQTNLMVMGPGNYKFKDYTKIGFPLTILYSFATIVFINYYYL